MSFVGIDSCPLGWFVVSIDKDLKWEIFISKSIEEIRGCIMHASLVLMDIPIGLPSHNLRKCDQEARMFLGRRASSVFSIPCREAVYAENYEQASLINKQVLGNMLSKQTWNICHKIKEVDQFLVKNPEARNNIRESHPEVCFWSLNKYNPMKSGKRNDEGIKERLRLLRSIFGDSKKIFDLALSNYKRNELGKDDILDAIVLALSATGGAKSLKTIPEVAGLDESDLPLEIVYRRF